MQMLLPLIILIQLTVVFTDLVADSSGISIEYPIKLAYINKVSDWSSPEGLAKSIGVPGYSQHSYNYIVLTFWTCGGGAVDAALLWENPTQYFGTQVFGSTND